MVAHYAGKWYNICMTDFGKGLPLIEANPWLRDEAERIARIIDVTERNSVIEGLPPLNAEVIDELRRELAARAANAPLPVE
jgi:hypothetical protein